MTPREKVIKAIEDGIEKISDVFDPLITAAEIKIGKLEHAGQDASNYYDLDEDTYTNFYEIRDIYVENKEKTILEFREKMDAELEKVTKLEQQADTVQEEETIPYEEVLYYLIKTALEQGVQIKIGDVEWDSGKPLGGKGSVFDELRDAAFKGVGIDPDSDLADIIRDPRGAVEELVQNVDAESKRALTDAKKAADKAATDAKNAIDKAATDVKREVDKTLTEAREAVEETARNVARELAKLPQIKVPKGPKIGRGFKW